MQFFHLFFVCLVNISFRLLPSSSRPRVIEKLILSLSAGTLHLFLSLSSSRRRITVNLRSIEQRVCLRFNLQPQAGKSFFELLVADIST